MNPPAYNPQSNGVAERAVQESTSQLRSLKLALESRLKVPIGSGWNILHLMIIHASYLICRCLRGADGKVPLGRLRGYESSRPIIEFGEQVWAKPLRTKAWNKRAPLASRWAAATWCGVNPKTGEHMVVLAEGGPLMKARTVKRRPLEERWSAQAIVEIEASLRNPDPAKVMAGKARRPTEKDVPDEKTVRGSGVMLEEPEVEQKRRQARDFRITHIMLEKYGKTEDQQNMQRAVVRGSNTY